MIENPCNEPWTVYVEAAKPWANKAAMGLLGVDLMQTVRTSLSPGALRSERHMRKGKQNTHPAKLKPKGIPDPYEYLGHILRKPIDKFIQANSTVGTKAIFSVVGVVERGLWEFMLLDVASEFLYHSFADARKSEYCRRWNNGAGLRSGPCGTIIAHGWQELDIVGDAKYADPTVGMPLNGAINFTADKRMELVVSFEGFAIGAGSQVHGLQIHDSLTDSIVAQADPRPYFSGEAVSFMLNATTGPGGYLSVRIYAEGGDVAGEGIYFATLS